MTGAGAIRVAQVEAREAGDLVEVEAEAVRGRSRLGLVTATLEEDEVRLTVW
jgi:hypothetical protein